MNTCESHDDGSVVVYTQTRCPLCELKTELGSMERQYEDKVDNLELDLEGARGEIDDLKLQVKDLENSIKSQEKA